MSVLANYQINGVSPVTIGGLGVARKFFPQPLNTSWLVPSLTPSATNAKGQLQVPGDNKLNGQDFEIVAIGAVNSDPLIACPTITVELLANTGTVATPNYVILASTAGITTTSLSFDDEPWSLRARVSGDSNSGIVGGIQTTLYNGILANSTPKATGVLSGINFGAAIPFGLVVAVTFSVTGANNTGSMYQFALNNLSN
jgi:hypothetical protein